VDDADKMCIEGSRSFVLNDGRQKLYGMLASGSSKQTFRNYCRYPVATKPVGADHGLFNQDVFVVPGTKARIMS
jgi:hypothetical protein